MTDVIGDGMLIVCVDMLSEEVVIGGAVDMLPEIENIVIPTPAITLEFVVATAHAGDVLTDMLSVITTDVVTAIDVVDMLTDENANGLAAVMTPLEFTLSAS